MATKKDLTKEEKIKREFSRLKRIFKDLDKNKLQTVESLIKNAAFMAVSLEELQEIINEEGYTVEYQNGANQSGTKQSDAVKTHIAMTKNHAAKAEFGFNDDAERYRNAYDYLKCALSLTADYTEESEGK